MFRLALLLCLPAAAAQATVQAELAALRQTLDEQSATIASLTDALKSNEDHVTDLGGAVDHAWLILCGALVMFMHAGFAMLETGSCRAKNVSNVLLKNLVNLCVGTIAWYIFGWAFAYGGPADADGFLDNGFIGTKQFAAAGFFETDAAGNQTPAGGMALGWFFQWAFCTAAATIVSGGVAERVQSPTYAVYAFFMAAFIYPVVVAWTWGYGWIMKMSDVDVGAKGPLREPGRVRAP
jgi:Amt family ammonium transporter